MARFNSPYEWLIMGTDTLEVYHYTGESEAKAIQSLKELRAEKPGVTFQLYRRVRKTELS